MTKAEAEIKVVEGEAVHGLKAVHAKWDALEASAKHLILHDSARLKTWFQSTYAELKKSKLVTEISTVLHGHVMDMLRHEATAVSSKVVEEFSHLKAWFKGGDGGKVDSLMAAADQAEDSD